MSILESDWKKYKTLNRIALDRFCQGVLAETKTVAQNGALSAHARYSTLYGLIHDRDREMARMFDGPSRSSAMRKLSLLVSRNLLTEAEISILSDDALKTLTDIPRRSYEIDWSEEIVYQD